VCYRSLLSVAERCSVSHSVAAWCRVVQSVGVGSGPGHHPKSWQTRVDQAQGQSFLKTLRMNTRRNRHTY